MIVATAIGFVGLAGLIGLAVWSRAEWAALICVFIFFNCGRGLLHGLELARIARAPRRQGLACPACHSAPPQGEFWTCSQCRKRFDFFATFAACPNCQAQFTSTRCLECGDLSPMSGWMGGPVPPVANLRGL